jgi:hypothetical protein
MGDEKFSIANIADAGWSKEESVLVLATWSCGTTRLSGYGRLYVGGPRLFWSLYMN